MCKTQELVTSSNKNLFARHRADYDDIIILTALLEHLRAAAEALSFRTIVTTVLLLEKRQ